ncbi:ABC transporter ATP-binding protein [Vallitalea guaymasensis]|uniref:ABC transporter ATP-binding protein n=1 Tax=Vallitalea guaymasensis TaxID=1185412 RepID=A0A8J8SAU6_9FIRM|nr:ABC transporter ATP-binding protein [Vallitalea guaymasensis]QUH27954.1 ABC transporter ATP-binding protein [Vallitalea guaymasensis]
MLKTISWLLKDNKKKLYLPIFLTIIDAIGSMALYFILYLTVVELLNDTLTESKIIIYTAICAASVIYRIIIYRKGYLLCFTRGFDVAHDVRVDLGEHICNLNLGYFNKNSIGHLMNTLTNDIASFEGVLSHALPFCIKTLTLVVLIIIGTFFINWQLALSQCLVIVISFPILHWSNRLVKKYGKEKRSLGSRMISVVIEYIKGFKVFKSHNLTDTHFERLIDTLEDTRKLSIKTEYKMAIPNCMYVIIVSFLTPLILLLGSYMVSGNELTAESFVAFMIMSLALSALLISFEHYYIMLNDLKLATSNLKTTFDYKPLSYTDSDFTLDNYKVSFINVDFSYESGKEVLHNINFEAKEKSITALVGPSGAGKSTIANLIARFWDPTKGSIEIGGRDIKDLNPDQLLRYISAVFQENVLLNDTILNNIKIGKPDATYKEIIEAAKLANCHGFITKLPDGYDTMVAQGGASLSGGEKQRIAIARAILKKAPILLLDESTASLDPDNEAKINNALDRLMKDKTVFVIAHRLNTIRNAHQIILLNDGKVEEIGNHKYLMKQKGHYYRMVKEQEAASEWIVKGDAIYE